MNASRTGWCSPSTGLAVPGPDGKSADPMPERRESTLAATPFFQTRRAARLARRLGRRYSAGRSAFAEHAKSKVPGRREHALANPGDVPQVLP